MYKLSSDGFWRPKNLSSGKDMGGASLKDIMRFASLKSRDEPIPFRLRRRLIKTALVDMAMTDNCEEAVKSYEYFSGRS